MDCFAALAMTAAETRANDYLDSPLPASPPPGASGTPTRSAAENAALSRSLFTRPLTAPRPRSWSSDAERSRCRTPRVTEVARGSTGECPSAHTHTGLTATDAGYWGETLDATDAVTTQGANNDLHRTRTGWPYRPDPGTNSTGSYACRARGHERTAIYGGWYLGSYYIGFPANKALHAINQALTVLCG